MSASAGGAAGQPTDDRAQPPAPGPLRPFHFPEIERSTLGSQITLLSARTGGPPVVTLALLLPAGGLRESPERAGLASLTGALLESGTANRAGPDIAETLEALGLQLSVGTSWDGTHIEVTGLRSRMESAVEVLADLVREPSFPEQEVARIRGEYLASIVQRRAEPRGLANEMVARFLFSDQTPFSRPLGGTSASLGGLTRQDVQQYHASHYTPLGASFVVAGALDAAEAEQLVAGAFNDWVGPRLEPTTVVVEPRSRATRVVVVDRPGSVQSELRVSQVGVARNTPDYFPLVVMNAILGGAFTSRLNLNLREKHGFTYGVSSAFAMRRHPGPFLVSTAVQTEVTAPALAEIWREIQHIRGEPVREQEVADARNYLAGIFPLRLQTTDGVASRLAELATYDLPLDYFEHYRERILAVDIAEVQRTAQQHLRPEEMVVVVVGDAATIRGPLAELGLGDVEVVDPAEVP